MENSPSQPSGHGVGIMKQTEQKMSLEMTAAKPNFI
jgi:hypothetical protein